MLRVTALGLLEKIAEKKQHVRRVKAIGLTKEVSEAIAKWLGEIRQVQVDVSKLVSKLSGELSLRTRIPIRYWTPPRNSLREKHQVGMFGRFRSNHDR
jgi:hypothetical protein